MRIDYPLKFQPNLHPALWGVESWEVSVHPAGPSLIANGPLAGRSLREVLPDFHLLIKVIDARTRLSVQVHPNERTAPLTGGDPKTEMWCLLKDGFIYAGLKPGTDSDAVASAVSSGRFEELLVRHDAKCGDAFFIPGGLVHAIGDDVKLFEVQQSSDTTYRLYDWGRVGKDGKPRELHVEKSLQAIDYALPTPVPAAAVRCGFFDFRTFALQGECRPGAAAAPVVLHAAHGGFTVDGVTVAEGESVLVPACLAPVLSGDSTVLLASEKEIPWKV